MHGPTAENITNGVSRMRVQVGSDVDADDTRRATGDESSDFHCEDEADDAEELEIHPLGVRGRGRGGCGCQQNWGFRGGRISKAPAGNKGDKHPTWSVGEMLKLARAKRDQQAYFNRMPHNYGRMRNREPKLQDLQKRLVEVGVKRTTDDIGKKWDNLFQQYKKILGDMQRPPSVAGESVGGGDVGDGNDEGGGSARESGFSAGSMGGSGKRKNMRQLAFDAIAKVMDSEKHGALMADTVEGASKRQCSISERQCDILERKVDTEKRHYEASDEANRMMCNALIKIPKAIRDMRGGAKRKGARPEFEKAALAVTDRGGQVGEDVSVMEIPSTGTSTLRFGRDGVSREHFQALAALGVPGIGHGGGSGSVRSQGIVISKLAPQTPMTSTTTIVSAVERADKGPVTVHVPQARHVESANTNTMGGSSREVVLLSHAGLGSGAVHRPSTAVGEWREGRGPDEAGRKDERRDGTPRSDDENDESLRMRKKKMRQEELEAKSKLWTNGKTFWGSGPGRLIVDAEHDFAD
ncbi:hypothetical protein CBR_g45409 [Chara braunii]|uniref:Myb/SANT-like DNA-binding domain-containing protein n=1 Tax=Chara braunii TaxID=69332 RepID=A0A388LYR3_CHABU|nr:hypothetical protein CBR_g45409 [Chara braunii]|eukprot:GBG87349.1 hypothetical protein CBR_g45409 [Chara braunii]